MKKFIGFLMLSGVLAGLLPITASANGTALTNLEGYSGVNPIQTSCSTCHTSPPALNAFGDEFLALGGSSAGGNVLSLPARNTLLTGDTDNDGISNLQELQNGTNPAGESAPAGQASVTGCLSVAPMSTMLLSFLFVISLMLKRRV